VNCSLNVFFLLAAICQVGFAARPWDEPFASKTAEISKAASVITDDDAEVVILLEDHNYVLQRDGKTASTERRVYKILTADALEEWASIEQQWEPWHETKPELRARVISPDGTAHWLDSKTIADAPAAQFDDTIYSDDRVVRAPLPAVVPGSVVEYEIVRHDTSPPFSAGITQELRINTALPIERLHLLVEAAKGVNLTVGSDLIAGTAISRKNSKDGTQVEVELSDLKPRKDIEFSVPNDDPQFPAFRFATGASWQAVAAAYERLVSQRIKANDSRFLLREMGIADMPKFASLQETADYLTSALHREIRYTGVEFGQAAIVPNAPSEVIRRHYGDCKDKATLLAALFIAAGFDAHVALLQAGQGPDVDPRVPGLGVFDHAIVFVAGREPMWIDATAESARPGTLPIGDQGRLALIADASTTTLTKTPVSSSAENRINYTVDILMRETGKAALNVQVEATGALEMELRNTFGGNEQEVRKAVERFGKESFGGASIGAFRVTKKGDFSQPFHLSVEVKDSSAAVTTLQEAGVRLGTGLLFEHLPFGLASNVRTSYEEETRRHDFAVYMPYHSEVHFKIVPPAAFSAHQLSPAQHFDTSVANYKMDSKRHDDGTVLVDYDFELSRRRLKPDDVEHLRAELKKLTNDGAQYISFAHRGADLIALGKTGQALQLAQKDVRENPGNALAQMRYSQLLLESGAGTEALLAAKKAVQDDPKSARAWLTLAYAYERDSFGRLRTGNWNPSEAEKALRKAMELDSTDIENEAELAILLEHDAAGDRYAGTARLAEAISVYQDILKKSPNSVLVRQNLVYAMIHAGRYKEAEEETTKIGEQADASLPVVLTALLQNTDEAILSIQGRFPDNNTRAQVLSRAGWILNQLRKYEAGADLLRAAQRLTSDAQAQQALRLLASTQAYEKALLPETDPRSPVQKFLVLCSRSGSSQEDLRALISQHAEFTAWQGRLEQNRNRLGVMRMSQASTGVGNSQTLADMVISHSKIETESGADQIVAKGGDSTAPQVSVLRPTHGRSKPAVLVTVTSQVNLGLLTFFVVEEGGKWKLLASGDGLEAVGRLALDALASGNLAAAQDWLDTVKNSALPLSPRDDKGPAIRYLWAGVAPETRSAAFVKAAAASLMGTYAGSPEAVAILKQFYTHLVPYMERDDIGFALCEALEKAQRWTDLRSAAEPLLKSRFYHEAGMRWVGESFVGVHDWDGLAYAAEARLATASKDHDALQFAAIAAAVKGDRETASKYLALAKDAPFGAYLPDDLLEKWIGILSKSEPEPSTNTANDTNLVSTLSSGSVYAYTLALTQLRGGNLDDCHRTLAAALNMDGKEPSGLAWLVEGEMLKQYALNDAATAAFGRARSSDGFGRLEFAKVLLER